MPEHNVDLFFSFRSPYSYLIMPDILKLREDLDVSVTLRPVYPIAVRDKEKFQPSNHNWARYIFLDVSRRAEMLGRPLVWPQPDPIVQDLETYEIADEQPYIFRLSHLGVEAERRGKGVEFATEVSALIFSGTRGWDKGDKLKNAVARAGLDLEDMDRAIDGGDHHVTIFENTKALDEAGHWGVPTCVFRGEPFFGQDRIDTLRWRIEQHLNKG